MADEILLTHAHVGHYAGLLYLGRECRDADGVPIHCSRATAEWFRSGNKTYHHLVARGNVDLRPFAPDEAFDLRGLTCRPFEVPHRNEDADTVGLVFEDANDPGGSNGSESGPDGTRFCYLPDLDRWTDQAEHAVRDSDVALVDGTFYSRDELDDRQVEDVPHPTIPATLDRLDDADTHVYFTHLNHTNPASDLDSAEHRRVVERGFGVASDGQVLDFE